MASYTRTAIYTSLKERNINKYKNTFELLPYTLEQLIQHLEGGFEENMTWENYGKWHVDHIKPMSLFNEASITLTKELSKKTKKDQGIYFTPNSIVKYIASFLEPYSINSVLEPSCGSCEFLEHFSLKSLTAIENNLEIYNNIKHKYPFVIHDDFLQHKFQNTFDLVVGNPPYFVLPKKMVDTRYYKYFDGRPNIYIIFIIKSFELLNENGILAFVLPTNFLNCIYYNELRKYLSSFNILDIKITREKFLETSQEICIFIIQKSPKAQALNDDFIVKFKNIMCGYFI